MTHSTRREEGTDSLSVMDFHYLVGTSQGIDYSHETHELGLFSHRQMELALAEAGFHDVQHDTQGLTGRGLYIARAGRPNS
jgi:hypothetical protein